MSSRKPKFMTGAESDDDSSSNRDSSSHYDEGHDNKSNFQHKVPRASLKPMGEEEAKPWEAAMKNVEDARQSTPELPPESEDDVDHELRTPRAGLSIITRPIVSAWRALATPRSPRGTARGTASGHVSAITRDREDEVVRRHHSATTMPSAQAGHFSTPAAGEPISHSEGSSPTATRRNFSVARLLGGERTRQRGGSVSATGRPTASGSPASPSTAPKGKGKERYT